MLKTAEKRQDVLLEYLENHISREDGKVATIPEARVREMISIRDELEEFQKLMMYYDCALSEVRTKLEVLNKELALVRRRNPIESIKGRLKTPTSIYEKMTRRGIEFTVENIEKSLDDIAGVRVICAFMDDIYMLRDCLVKQDDVTVLLEKDYIRQPKDNGYRSLHLILEIPIFLTNEKRMTRVEVQFRTIAMDFWASLEHELSYKKRIPNQEAILEELKLSADLINQIDRRMLQIREKLDVAE